MGKRILVIDDDNELCELLADYLSAEGFEVMSVSRPEQGIEQALSGRHDLVVLDVMLPGGSGFDILRSVRAKSAVPVVMLTARGDEVDRIVGLEMGADDYVPKPFNPRELVARIRAVERRAEPPAAGSGQADAPAPVTVGDLVLDPARRTVTRGEKPVDLTSVEFDILEVLLRRAGCIVSREEMAREALGRSHSAFDRSVDVHISSLRRKLGSLARGAERIKTVRGTGYLYVLPESAGTRP